MANILDTIIDQKREEIRLLRRDRSAVTDGRSSPNRGFASALKIENGLALISEVKRASPSKGLIRENFDAVVIAKEYEEGQASAISVLTDEHFFQGHTSYLTKIRDQVSLPLLRKDFIIDPIQVEQTATLNADGMLLIAAALSDNQLEELYSAAKEMDLDPLIEVHNARELERVMRFSPQLIGINNRDLTTFETSLQTTIDLIKTIPDTITVVSESGIFTGEDTARLIESGVSAVLVGESLMRSEDIGKLIAELRHIS